MITRKNFLTLAGSSIVLGVIACGDDESTGSGGNGAGASGSSSSSSGTGASGGSGSGSGGSGSGGSPSGGGGNGSGGGMAGACTANVMALISLNHTPSTQHTLTIPLADIMAGVDKTYDTAGPATHCHRVTLTAADFQTLQMGGSVTKFSCNGTDHEFVISCGANPPMPMDPMCPTNDTTGTCN